MPTLDELRSARPEWKNVSDDALVRIVRRRYFPDEDESQVAERVGYKPPPPPEAPTPEPTLLDRAKDVGISAVRGAIGVPEALVGLADIPTGGRVGKFLENEGGLIGFRPKEAKAMLAEQYSPAQQAAFRKVQNAEGVIDIAGAALSNPSVLAQAAVESLPLMGAGGVVARGITKVAPGVAASFGGIGGAAAGEGIVGAGSAAEQIRQQTPDGLLTGDQSLIAGATGAATGGFSVLGAKLAQRIGVGDIDMAIAGAARSPAAAQSLTRRVLGGMVSEGLLEELPQSVAEQVLQNQALGKPLEEGVDQAAVLGTLTGAAFGGGFNLIAGAPPAPDVVPPPAAGVPDPAGIVPPAAQAVPDPVAPVTPPAGPAERAAQIAEATGATPAPEPEPVTDPDQSKALLDHANSRYAELQRAEKGIKEQKDGTGKVVSQAQDPRFLTPEEEEEKAWLEENGGNAAVLQQRYGQELSDRMEDRAMSRMAAQADQDGFMLRRASGQEDSFRPEHQAAMGAPVAFTEPVPDLSRAGWDPEPAEPDEDPGRVSEIAAAAAEAAEHPANDLKPATDGQKDAGNYKMGHTKIAGMNVSIETPEGALRKSKADAPTPWEVKMPAHYGYIKGTKGADGDHVDLTIGPKGDNGRFFVIDQQHPDGSGFDEHKVFTGVDSAEEARDLYNRSFTGDFGNKTFMSISGEMDAAQFKTLLPSLEQPQPVAGVTNGQGVSQGPSVRPPNVGSAAEPAAAEPDNSEAPALRVGVDRPQPASADAPATTGPADATGRGTADQESASPVPGASLRQHFYDGLKAGNLPADNVALKKIVEQLDGKPAEQLRLKEAQEDLEAAIAQRTRDVAAEGGDSRSTFDKLVAAYDAQPRLNIRTSTSVANQAYSTPAPLAFLANDLIGVKPTDTMLEPTAGTGMLAVRTPADRAHVNEFNAKRADLLAEQGFTVTREDATKPLAGEQVDVVLTNPPFGSAPAPVKVDGFTLKQIDHVIAANALGRMKDDGRATLILGASKEAGGVSDRDRVFFNWLYSHYNVARHFEVDGKLYQRQGASWPVRVITIEGRRADPALRGPKPGSIKRADTWEQVYELGQERAAAAAAGSSDSAQPAGSGRGDGDVAGGSAAPVVDSPAVQPERVGKPDRAERPSAEPAVAGGTAPAAPVSRSPKPAGEPGVDASQFQVEYTPQSQRKDKDVLVPVNMAEPLRRALAQLEDDVGDLDEFARSQLGYGSVDEMLKGLMGLQVDSVASAIHQATKGKAVIIADQTGIGKGRQAAAMLKWAMLNGKTPVFLTVKPSLFTDMFEEMHAIGATDVQPFLMNSDAWVTQNGKKTFTNKAKTHDAAKNEILATGKLPEGRNALFLTYSQINKQNTQRDVLRALGPNAFIVMDESHNAAGDSATGKFVREVIESAYGVTYLSATYAKRPDNMDVYFRTDMGTAVAGEALADAMNRGGLPLQTLVANNLVAAGQMFRRERSFKGVEMRTLTDTKHRDEHISTSDAATEGLRAIVAADRAFHTGYMKSLKEELEAQGEGALDGGNEASESVDHTAFTSVVHNFVRQMLLGMKAQRAAEEAIDLLKRKEKPLIAVENTMGALLAEYAKANNLKVGDSLEGYDYRAVLSRALERSRAYLHKLPNGDKERVEVSLAELDPETRALYDQAQEIIDGLEVNFPVSPIDWMRHTIQKAGFTVGEITGRGLVIDYSSGKPVLASLSKEEQEDKGATASRFNNDGGTDALILNVAGATGISLHSSEKFKNLTKRTMIVAQPAQDINIFMQMLGRVHRTGQKKLPGYILLEADLPAERRPNALLAKKMKSLNANTSSNTESDTSVRSADFLNKYGDAIVTEWVLENRALAQEMGVDDMADGTNDEASEDIARKVTGRLALMPVAVQQQAFDDIEARYNKLIDYLNETNQNDLEPRTLDLDARETKSQVIVEGKDPSTPFGADTIYNEYSIKSQGKAMTVPEIQELVKENLGGKSIDEFTKGLKSGLESAYQSYDYGAAEGAEIDAMNVAEKGRDVVDRYRVGQAFDLKINDEQYVGVVTNIRNGHKKGGNPYALSKFTVTFAVNGSLRSVSIPGSQLSKIVGEPFTGKVRQSFEEVQRDERETAKVITGNVLAAYDEMTGVNGRIVAFTKADGTTEQGILLPKTFTLKDNLRHDVRLRSGADAARYLEESRHRDTKLLGISTRDQKVRVTPGEDGSIIIRAQASKAGGMRYWSNPKLLEAADSEFASGGKGNGKGLTSMKVGPGRAARALDALMDISALYVNESRAADAKQVLQYRESGTFAAAAPAAGVAREATQAEVEALFGKTDAVTIVNTPGDLPAGRVRDFLEKHPTADAVTVDGDNVILVASRLQNVGEVRALVMHEVGVHVGLGEADTAQLTRLIEQWAAGTGPESTLAKAALKAGGASSSDVTTQEPLAYFVEFAVASGIDPLAPTVARGLFRRLVLAAKMALRRLGLNTKISPADVVAYAHGSARKKLSRAQRADNPFEDGSVQASEGSAKLASALMQGVNNVQAVKLPAGHLLGDWLSATPGKVHWWHKSVGSPYNLAQRYPSFRPVYEGVQRLLEDVSRFATEAASLAPNILPKLESWQDIFKPKVITAADNAALAQVYFDGTLRYGRDEDGDLVKLSESDAKLKAGVVFTRSELRNMGLTEQQIDLYGEARAATNRSLDDMAIAQMLRLGGRYISPTASQEILDQHSLAYAAETLRDALTTAAAQNPNAADTIMGSVEIIDQIREKIQGLKGQGYAPLSRFGRFTVDVLVDGKREFFSLYETDADRKRAVRQLAKEFPGATITQGTTSQEAYKLFESLTPDTAEIFGEILGLDSTGDSAADKAFQEFLKLTRAQTSSMKRLIHRKGIEGFSMDAGRVLAGFVYSNARLAANTLNRPSIDRAVDAIDQGEGDLKDQAVKLRDYALNPQEEAQAWRGLLFVQYLGGSIASAIVNATQPFMVTAPWLSQYGGAKKAGAAMANALKIQRSIYDSKTGKSGDNELDAALLAAEEDGTVAPQEVHQLMAQAQGRATLRAGDGTKAGDAYAKAQNFRSRVMLGWGKVFGVAEQFNRRLTFIAAYNVARDRGMPDPASFAKRAVNETQFVYNKGNKPRWARGVVGSLAFTFKQYSVSYLELLARMWNGPDANADSRRAMALMLLALLLMSGADGLPFMENIDDVVDGTLQRMGYNAKASMSREQFLRNLLGEDLGRVMQKGVSGLGNMPFDVSGRLGMGKPLPGTGLFVKKEDNTRDLAELAGPSGDLLQRGFKSINQLFSGDPLGAAVTIAPTAVRNAAKGVQMASTGEYRDSRDKKVIDTTTGEALLKGIGFQPSSVARQSEADRTAQVLIANAKMREGEIATKWARGEADGDQAKVAEAKAEVADWNEKNPDTPIKIERRQIRQRVANLKLSRADRLAKTAPKEIRERVRKELEGAQ